MIAELRVRGDPRVSPLHCLEEDDDDSGAVSDCGHSPTETPWAEGPGPAGLGLPSGLERSPLKGVIWVPRSWDDISAHPQPQKARAGWSLAPSFFLQTQVSGDFGSGQEGPEQPVSCAAPARGPVGDLRTRSQRDSGARPLTSVAGDLEF